MDFVLQQVLGIGQQRFYLISSEMYLIMLGDMPLNIRRTVISFKFSHEIEILSAIKLLNDDEAPGNRKHQYPVHAQL